jgi:putative DNA primase/helicase
MNIHHGLKDRLKTMIDPISFYQHEGQEIKIAGQREWKIAGLCPFHADKQAGSFYINAKNGTFQCFSCDATGDIIEFTRQKYELSFIEALHKLSNDWRVA